MGELLIKEGTMFHTILAQKFRCNEERTDEIKKFAQSIIRLLGGFNGEIANACRNFFRKLKIDQNEDENIIFMSKYIIDILNQLSKKITIINKKIQLDVVDPLNQFISNQKSNHVTSLIKSEELLYSLQGNNEMLRELVKNYQINQASLNKSSEERLLLKKIVQSEIEKCNMKWQQIKNKYQSIVTELNSYNSLRCHFTMKTQIEIVKLINRLVNSTSVQQSLEQYEDMFTENETLALQIKDQMRQRLGKLIIFEQAEVTDISNMISDNVDERQKKIIDEFINLFTNRSNLNEDDTSFEQSRTLILQDMRWTNYFLTKLKNNLYTEIKLNNNKFRQLASIVKYIFAIVVQAQGNQSVLYSLLFISYRVRCKDQYLIRQLGKHDDFWKNHFLWNNIVQYIKLIKLKSKQNAEKQPRKRWRGIFSKHIWSAQNLFSNKKLRSEKVIQDAKIFQILFEINYYMTKLELEQTFVFDFMLSQTQKYNISKENTKKLLQYHYLNKMITTNKQSSTTLMRKARLQQEYKKYPQLKDKVLFAIGQSLKYIPIGTQLSIILLVSKQWNNHLRNKVFKRYLIEEDINLLTNKTRLKIYKQICHPPFSRTVYQRMIEEVPQFTQHIDIIYLDARRSLGWDQTLRIKMVQVLKAFSFYHPDHGYLQGMNYLCENILKLTDDSYICYFIFEHLMNNQYYGMYTSNFDGLKVKIYQFMRMLDRERPELADHLRAEKIQGQHFMLSWAITLWGQMSGQLSWILWDGFLIQGWIWWFKMTLWLMKVLEPQLIKMNFEQIMKCFSDLHTSLFSLRLDQLGDFGISKQRIKTEINSILIEKDVLAEIQKQYRLKSNIINEYIKKSTIRKK